MAATAPRMQARGKARRELLMQAAQELLDEMPLDEISLADIADRAGIPTGSAYHFFGNTYAVFEALSAQFGEGLDAALREPYYLEPGAGWLDVIDIAINRGAEFYAANPGYRELILGSKTPPEIKYSDRQHDRSIGGFLSNQINQHFHLPEIPRRDEIFFNMVEIVDLLYQLSYIQEGTITQASLTDAKLAAHAYLRIYLPEVLERR